MSANVAQFSAVFPSEDFAPCGETTCGFPCCECELDEMWDAIGAEAKVLVEKERP